MKDRTLPASSMSRDRESILAAMGYRDYEHYLSRALRKKIKYRVLERDGHTCLRCNGQADRVHHRSYSEAVLKGTDDEQLASLCEGCHHVVEFDEEGSWRSHCEEEAVLSAKCARSDYPEIKINLRQNRMRLPEAWDRMNWWQRMGYRTAYKLAHQTRKPSGYGAIMMEYWLTVLDVIQHRTAVTHWRRDLPDLEAYLLARGMRLHRRDERPSRRRDGAGVTRFSLKGGKAS
ncbi:HNH endonuclease [Cupriavidus sp. TMH.W2]|uniref:HNH endonuclease n=1 Tax=Cupriavidus sp. TMH.W2 TaxID=3434465 RepID=UPI003D77BD2D